MNINGRLSTREIDQVFRSEIAARKGVIWDAFDDGSDLYLRATLPTFKQVQLRDWVQGGVALRANSREISVHPYTLRKICSNGAIMVQGVHSFSLRHTVDAPHPTSDVIASLRNGIRGCCGPEAFQEAASDMQTAVSRGVDIGVFLNPMLRLSTGAVRQRLLGELVNRFLGMKDHSLFALMNLITARARDEPDPALRWDLEVIGGTVAATRGVLDQAPGDSGLHPRMRNAA